MQELNLYADRFTTGKEFMQPGKFPGSVTLDDADRNRYESVIANTLALAYEYLGKTDKAKYSYLSAIKLNPDYDLAWYNLGLLSLLIGEHEQARNALLQLQSLNPSLAKLLTTATNELNPDRLLQPQE